MSNDTILGIDLGGTNIRCGLVNKNSISQLTSQKINAQGSVEDVLQQLFIITDPLINDSVIAIGMGVPGLVDTGEGVVYDVVNIPSWKEVPLKKLLEQHYRLPVLINNDANCFALGEYYFGQGQGCNSMIGLTIGTGMGSGLIIDGKLYSGKSGGAGEFGMMDYLDKYYEYYASGQFFQNVYGKDGGVVFEKALEGNKEAIKMYEEMGSHLGYAIKTILYALDIELIVLGGSVRQAYSFFSKTMWQQIQTIAFKRTADQLKIKVSELENSGILGAASLYYDSMKEKQ